MSYQPNTDQHCKRTLAFDGSTRLQRSRRGLAKVIIAGSQVAAHARRRTWFCRQKSDISSLYFALFQSNRRAQIDNGGAPIPDVRSPTRNMTNLRTIFFFFYSIKFITTCVIEMRIFHYSFNKSHF